MLAIFYEKKLMLYIYQFVFEVVIIWSVQLSHCPSYPSPFFLEAISFRCHAYIKPDTELKKVSKQNSDKLYTASVNSKSKQNKYIVHVCSNNNMITSCSGQTSGWWCSMYIPMSTTKPAGIVTLSIVIGDVSCLWIPGTGAIMRIDSLMKAVSFGMVCKFSLKFEIEVPFWFNQLLAKLISKFIYAIQCKIMSHITFTKVSTFIYMFERQ